MFRKLDAAAPRRGNKSAAALLERLIAVVEGGGDDGVLLSVRGGNAYCLRSLRTSGAFLSIVLKGQKRIHHGAECIEVVPGHAAVIAAACCIDVENIPDPASGQYLAALIIIPEVVLTITRALLGENNAAWPLTTGAESPCSAVPLTAIAGELAQCIEFGTPSALPRFHHALAGLLLKLTECGIAAFLQPARPRLADSIGSLLAGEPAREWRSADVEERLAMSGATLRRQLAAEQTSLRQNLTEARLGQALQLLQGTRLPVKTVAARSGYRSVSSFVRRFQERYGVDPSRVANAG